MERDRVYLINQSCQRTVNLQIAAGSVSVNFHCVRVDGVSYESGPAEGMSVWPHVQTGMLVVLADCALPRNVTVCSHTYFIFYRRLRNCVVRYTSP